MLNPNFVIFGAGLNFIGTLSYLTDTIKGKTKPNRISWFMWALAPLIAFGAELHEGVGIQALMTFMTGFGPLLIFTASFLNKKSIWQLTRFDYACGGLSLLGLALWLLTRHGDIAIAFSIAADALAAIPTIVKSYKAPESENWKAFGLAGVSAGITILTIKDWNFATYGFPIYIFLICALFFVLIKFKLGNRLSRRVVAS